MSKVKDLITVTTPNVVNGGGECIIIMMSVGYDQRDCNLIKGDQEADLWTPPMPPWLNNLSHVCVN